MAARRKDLLDQRHPFFRPFWRRIAVVLLLAFWTVIEIVSGNPFWALLVGGIGAYAIYVFFFDFDLPGDHPTDKDAS